jgi:hypothetical protein
MISGKVSEMIELVEIPVRRDNLMFHEKFPTITARGKAIHATNNTATPISPFLTSSRKKTLPSTRYTNSPNQNRKKDVPNSRQTEATFVTA